VFPFVPDSLACPITPGLLGVPSAARVVRFTSSRARRVSPPALRLMDYQAAHGGVKTSSWVMMVAMSSAAHSSLILPSVIR